jgi:hypothetical protein
VPAPYGEYLKAAAASERALAGVIARRIGAGEADLGPLVLAAVVAAERAVVLHWVRRARPSAPLADVVRAAVAPGLLVVADRADHDVAVHSGASSNCCLLTSQR